MCRLMVTVLLSFMLLNLIPNDGVAASSKDVVYNAQNRLSELGYRPGIADGIFGKKTQAALLNFQRDHDLPETGILDTKTLNQLRSVASPESSAQQPSESDSMSKKLSSKLEPSGLDKPQNSPLSPPDRVEEQPAPQPEPTVPVVARHTASVRTASRDPRLDATWGLLSPTGCYWECQQKSGCYDGKKDGVSLMADHGVRRGVDAQRVYHHTGWTQVCD